MKASEQCYGNMKDGKNPPVLVNVSRDCTRHPSSQAPLLRLDFWVLGLLQLHQRSTRLGLISSQPTVVHHLCRLPGHGIEGR